MSLFVLKEWSLQYILNHFFCFLGIALVYDLGEDLVPLKHCYLADELTVARAVEKIVGQGKPKHNQLDEGLYPKMVKKNHPFEESTMPDIAPTDMEQ